MARRKQLPLRIRAMNYALYAACADPDPEVAAFALAHGADVSGDGGVPTPLNLLCDLTRYPTYTTEIFAVVELLLAAGADVNVVSQSCVSPIYFAAYRGDYRLVELLLKAGADVNMCGAGTEKIITRPVVMGWLDIVSLLVDAGCELDDIDHRGTDARAAAELWLYGDTQTDALALIDAAIASRNQSRPGVSNNGR